MVILDKIGNWMDAGVRVFTNWAEEPLKKWEHEREDESKKRESENRIKEDKAKSDLKIKEDKAKSEIKMAESKHKSDLKIKEETEIKRIFIEIEQAKKDREFERMKSVSEAIIHYQRELTKINVDAIAAIGEMSLELRNKAQKLVLSNVQKYKNLQDVAFQEAIVDSKRIENEFKDNERAQEILYKAVDKKLATIIDSATVFIKELNNDIKALNTNIDLLAKSGQKFIEKHLQEFKMLGMTREELDQISDSKVTDAEVVEE